MPEDRDPGALGDAEPEADAFSAVGPPSIWDDDPTDAPVEQTATWSEDVPDPTPPPPLVLEVPTPAFRPPPDLPTRSKPFDEVRLLDAISARATSRRVRRRARALGVMSGALVLLMITTAFRLAGDGDDLATRATSTTIDLSPVTDPPEAFGVDDTSTTFSLPPRLTPITPSPSTTVAAAATSTSQRPTTTVDPRPVGDRPDGVPGWTNGQTSCAEAFDLPPDAGSPTEALKLSVTASGTTARSGGELGLILTISNTGPPITVFYRTPTSRTDAWFLSTPSVAASATLTLSAAQRDAIVVPPGTPENPGEATLTRTVRAVRCGDTSTDPPPGITPGTYDVGASLEVSLTPTGTLRPWRSPLVEMLRVQA